jgi:ABC-2 type transport system ATP-binding protein
VLLTTQYLDEADQLAGRVVVVDHGRVIAEGVPGQLKARLGGEEIEVTVRDRGDLGLAAGCLGRATQSVPTVNDQDRTVSVPVPGGFRGLAAAIRELDGAGLTVEDLTVRRATLDDVFLRLTGRRTDERAATGTAPPVKEPS